MFCFSKISPCLYQVIARCQLNYYLLSEAFPDRLSLGKVAVDQQPLPKFLLCQ